jgi:membrane protease YdiL (CAAX protease family)
MSLFHITLLHQLGVLRRNLWAFALLLGLCAVVLWHAAQSGHAGKALAYLVAVALCCFITDLVTLWRSNAPAFEVRRPVREAVVVLAFSALGYLGLCLRFTWLDWPALPGLARLAILPLFGFVFPIFIAIVMLLVWRYTPRALGFRWSPSCWVFLPVLLVTAGTALLVAPQDLTIGLILQETGVLGALWMGFVVAALSEEFLRLLLQTRLGAVLNNAGLAALITALIWACMHAPKWIGEGGSAVEGLLGALHIVPLGLLWGYLTHRTRSIVPAILVHGLNVWGLQNF